METKILLNKIIDRKDLTVNEAGFLLDEIIDGKLNNSQIAAVLVGLRSKGESVSEITGFIESMRRHMVTVAVKGAIDIVGTGGDGFGTFNISTAASLVVASCGIKVAKHGNRAASSRCGSADVLEALGVNIMLKPQQAEKVLQKVGMVFLFAPLYHPAMKNIAPIRKELGVRTVFNFLGPFLNPAGVKQALIGVPNVEIAKKLALVAAKLNYQHLLLVASRDGMDEISISGKTEAFVIKKTNIKAMVIDPQRYGFGKSSITDILGGDSAKNARIITDILDGKKGVRRDIVLFNSANAFYVAGKVENVSSGIALAKEAIDSGGAKKVLENLIKETKKYG